MTENDDPSPDRWVATAVVVRLGVAISSRSLAHAESGMVPVWSPTVADLRLNATRSKLASGSGAQALKQIDGASTYEGAVGKEAGGDRPCVGGTRHCANRVALAADPISIA